MSTTRVLPAWRPIGTSESGKCIAPDCPQDAAWDRADGRCYLHGKQADGLMAKYEPKVGRPANGRSRNAKDHRRRSA